MPFAATDFAACAALWKEHSGASAACTWLAILRFDYHSLTRQRNELMLSVVREHCSNAAMQRKWPFEKMQLIIAILSTVHSERVRCHLDLDPAHLERKRRLPASNLLDRPPDHVAHSDRHSDRDACGPLAAFDVSRLPYRWLPGLPPPHATGRHLLSTTEATSAPRLEVMHARALALEPTTSRPIAGLSCACE